MPHVVAFVLIGAGVAAGLTWAAKELRRASHNPRLARQKPRRRPHVTTSPKDLGALEWDAKAGVYRPSAKR